MAVVYPVILSKDKDGYFVTIPDFDINTEGKTLEEAIFMARDAIGISCIEAQDEGKEISKASNMTDVDVSKGTFGGEGTSVVSLVDVDLEVYRRMLDNKTVRRNVTLPNWLNQEAERSHINVSKVLQEALMARLGVSR